MKHIVITIAALFLATACASIDKSSLNGKEVITATHSAPVIFGMFGAPAEKCLADLNKEGVKSVETVVAASNEKTTILSRLSSAEFCQATGSK